MDQAYPRLRYRGEQDRSNLYRHVACILVEDIKNKHVNHVASDLIIAVLKRIKTVVKERSLFWLFCCSTCVH